MPSGNYMNHLHFYLNSTVFLNSGDCPYCNVRTWCFDERQRTTVESVCHRTPLVGLHTERVTIQTIETLRTPLQAVRLTCDKLSIAYCPCSNCTIYQKPITSTYLTSHILLFTLTISYMFRFVSFRIIVQEIHKGIRNCKYNIPLYTPQGSSSPLCLWLS